MKPVVSIVIPVFNRLDCTQPCIEAIFACTPELPYEIILVDNGSTDGTPAYLETLTDPIHVLRNPVNRGFACACNQGAAAAQGDHLIFLNNDTEVRPHWSPPLFVIKEQKVLRGPAQAIKAYQGNHTQQTLDDMEAFMRKTYLNLCLENDFVARCE